MLICLLSKQIFPNLLKIRRSSFSKSACLFLRSGNRMNKKQYQKTKFKGKCKERICMYTISRETHREDILYIYNIYSALYTTDVLHKLEYASDMQTKSTTQETRQTNDHKWWLRSFFGHIEMGNIYEQVMFLLHP